MRGQVDLAGVLLEDGQTWEDLRAQCDRSAVRVEALCGIVSLGGAEVTLEDLSALTGRSAQELAPALARLVTDALVTCWTADGADCWQVTAAGYHEVELLRISENVGYHPSEPR